MVKKTKKEKDIFEQEARLRLQARKQRHRKKFIQKYTKKRIIIPAIIMIALVSLGIFSFIHSLSYQSTDDAFIEGNLVSVAPKVAGQVVKLNFNDNDYVKKGQLLLEIDSRDYQNKVDELSASVAEAKSKHEFTQKDYDRYSKLIVDGLCTKQEYESAKTHYDISKANIEKLEAQLAQARLNLSYTKIYAPQDGNISSRSVELGNYVQVGQALTAIVSPNIWIVANFKETQLTNMQKGQEVSIKIDTYPNKVFKGKVDSIQKASGAKASLFPPENAVGSYVKVVQRIPVKITFDDDISKYNIAPGMSVVPKVKIK